MRNNPFAPLLVVAGVCAALGVCAVARLVASPEPPVAQEERSSAFHGLKPGDPVALKGTALGEQGQYTITHGLNGHTHTVTHVGKDFVVLSDRIGIQEYSIPVTSVRAVIKATVK